VIFNHAKVISIDWLSYTIFDITRCPSSRSLHVHLATCTRRGIENYRQRAGVPMAQRNEIHAGSITGSVVVAGSGNTINARLRVELGIRARSGERSTMPARSLPSQRRTRKRSAARSNARSIMQGKWRVWAMRRSSSRRTSISSQTGWAANGRAC